MDHSHHIVQAFDFTAFFLAGLLGSFHCVGMCGPLSALFAHPSPDVKKMASYHAARMASYAAVGFSLNAAGARVTVTPHPLLIWAVLIPLLLFSFGLHLKAPRFLMRFQGRVLKRTAARYRPAVLGALTPLIPCGLSYALLAASLAAPSPALAAGWMGAFAAGTIPLLFSSQMGISFLYRKVPARHVALFLRGLSFMTAGSLLWFTYFHHWR